MEGKKISFSFMKTKKQEKPITAEKKEYIECVEEKSIKVMGGDVTEEIKPLVIPMKPNTLITAEKLKEIAEQAENFDGPEIKNENNDDRKITPENETLDQMAVRELMEESKKEIIIDTPKLIVPINSKPVMTGHTEATLEDYESVPIQEFGLAMLRGMGWTPGKESKYKQPQLRPKGLGLGADKVIKENQKNKSKDKEEELSIVKNSFVKITAGKHSGYYGKVVSLDEDNGRVLVDLTIKKETVSLSEFMMQPVSKSEFDKQSKVINTDSYEKYKKKEMVSSSKEYNSSKTDEVTKEGSSSRKSNDLSDKDQLRSERRREDYENNEKYSNGRNKYRENERYRRESSNSEERNSHRKKNKKKYSSNESLSSETDNKKISGSRRRHSNTSESSDSYKKEKHHKSKSSKERRDIDKKRKGKKKKRDRDRSPNYKKHRK